MFLFAVLFASYAVASLEPKRVLENIVYRNTQLLHVSASSASLSAGLTPDKAVLLSLSELSIVDTAAGALLYHGNISDTFYYSVPGSLNPGHLVVPDVFDRAELPLSVTGGGFNAINDDQTGAAFLSFVRIQQYQAHVLRTVPTSAMSNASLAEYSLYPFADVQGEVVLLDNIAPGTKLKNGSIAVFSQRYGQPSYEQAKAAVDAGAVAVIIYALALSPPGGSTGPVIPVTIDPALRSAIFQPLRPNATVANLSVPVLGLSHNDGAPLVNGTNVTLFFLPKPRVITDVLIARDTSDFPAPYASPTSNASFNGQILWFRFFEDDRAYRNPRVGQNFESVFITLSSYTHDGHDWNNLTGAVTLEFTLVDLLRPPLINATSGFSLPLNAASIHTHPLPPPVPSQERTPTLERFMPLFLVSFVGQVVPLFVNGSSLATRQCIATGFRFQPVQPELGPNLAAIEIPFPTPMAFARQRLIDGVWRTIDGQAQPAPGKPIDGGSALCQLSSSPIISQGSLYLTIPYQSDVATVTSRWFEFDVSGYVRRQQITLRQWGDIPNTIYPSISVDRAGNVGFAATLVSPTQPAVLAYTGRLATDPLNSMALPLQTPILNTHVYSDRLSNPVNSWSPSSVNVEPLLGETFSVFSQYPSQLYLDVAPSGISSAWSVGMATFKLYRPPCVDACGDADLSALQSFVTRKARAPDHGVRSVTASDLAPKRILDGVIYRNSQLHGPFASSADLSVALSQDKAVMLSCHELSIADTETGVLVYHGNLSDTFLPSAFIGDPVVSLLLHPDVTSRAELPVSVKGGGFNAINDDQTGADYVTYVRVQQYQATVDVQILPPLTLNASIAEFSQFPFSGVQGKVVVMDNRTAGSKLDSGSIAVFSQHFGVPSYDQAKAAVDAGAIAVIVYSFGIAPEQLPPLPPLPTTTTAATSSSSGTTTTTPVTTSPAPFPIFDIPTLDPSVWSPIFQLLRPNATAANLTVPVLGLSYLNGASLVDGMILTLSSLPQPKAITDVLIVHDKSDYPKTYASPTSNASFSGNLKYFRFVDSDVVYRNPRVGQNFESIFITVSSYTHDGRDWNNLTGTVTIEFLKRVVYGETPLNETTNRFLSLSPTSVHAHTLPPPVPSQERSPVRERFMPLFLVSFAGQVVPLFVNGSSLATRQCIATGFRFQPVQPELGPNLAAIEIPFPTPMAFARQRLIDGVWRTIDGQAQPAPGKPIDGGSALCQLSSSPIISQGSLYLTIPYQSDVATVTSRWFEFDVSGYVRRQQITLRQWGDIPNTIYPSISVDRAGNVGFAATLVSPTQPAVLAYTGRLATDPLNSMALPLQTPILNTHVYSDRLSNPVNSWSPSSVNVEPLLGETFSVFSQYPSQLFRDIVNGTSSAWVVGMVSFKMIRPPCVDICGLTLNPPPTQNGGGGCGLSLIARHRHKVI